MLVQTLSQLAIERLRLIDASSQCVAAVSKIRARDDRHVDLEAPIESVGFSIATLHARAELVASMTPHDTSINVSTLTSLPTRPVSGLRDSIREVSNKLLSIFGLVEEFGEFSTGDEKGHVYTNADNTKSLDLGTEYTSLADLIDAALTLAYTVRNLLIASAPPDMSEVVEKLGQVRAKLASLEVDGNKSLERIEAAKTAAEEKALFIDNQSKVVGENSAAVLEKRNEADEQARLLIESALRAEERSLSLLEKVDEIISRASDVKATVDAYKESFTAFDNQLEARSR